ncbi:Cell division protein FtsL [Rickettsia felis URRWXCal2]|uniref:Cell division protein FtsL n=2 Tax=Rickettsia felis TaxID=42862 RepID=Q4UL19_RICFE|nr:Cell division protein FtsL [Rickettsia felis URRWXCal2]
MTKQSQEYYFMSLPPRFAPRNDGPGIHAGNAYAGMISNAFKRLSKYYRKYKSNLVMTIRKFHYLTLLITIIAICSLFSIKERVSTLDYQLSSVVKQINSENNNIHILKAEQAYLLLPARLEKLAAAYLKLETVKSYQMIKDPLGPNIDQNIKFNHNISISKSSKWRYKRITNNKYIQTVSSRTKH